jgi:hypothetical protein
VRAPPPLTRVPPLTSVRVAAPADSGQLQIKEVLPIPYTVYMNVDRNQARIFLFGIGTKDTVVVETSGYSELIIGVLKKQHDSSRKEKQERGWVLDSMSDPTGVVDLHVKSAAVTEAGSSDEYMPYDWNKVKLKCKVTLSRPLDPNFSVSLVQDVDSHLERFPETAQVQITVQLLKPTVERATAEGGHGLSSSGPE